MRLTCLLLILPILLPAQTESWAGVTFEHEVTPRWGYVIEAQHRRSLTDSPDGTFLLMLAGNRPLARNLSLTLGTRFETADAGGDATFRLFSDLNYKIPLGNSRFTLESRLRYQQDGPPVNDGSQPLGSQRRTAIRPRLGIATKLSDRFTLITEFEGRFRFDRRDEWSRVRYTAGFECIVNDHLNLELFWRQEDRINQLTPRSTTIFGLYADYTLPDKRNREWKYRHPFGRKVTW